ncbi:MAG: DNA polymerase III subunit delta [Bifidobacteriaceae bacterium]|jgi:DNA polymerase-3 subunit delta|nr:DNA polymerase III subunit delta [Bifidobacteriaceae bacterium]
MPPRAKTSIPWERAEPAPLVLVAGPEDLLGERAIARVTRLAQQADPDTDVTNLNAAAPNGLALAEAASGDLFTTHTVVVVRGVERITDEFLAEALDYAQQPNPDAVVIFRHSGGNRGKKLLDTLRANGAVDVTVPVLKWDSDKDQFVTAEFRSHERLIDQDAVRALVEAIGGDLAELAAACNQLAADTQGRISRAMVDRYYGGKIETTAFKVAEAAVVGDVARALTLARHVLGSGLDPVPLVAALGSTLRTMARVGGAKAAKKNPAQDFGIQQWQEDKAWKQLRGWDGPRLGRAILAVERADAEVKGLGGAGTKTARAYAVERAIVAVASAARG